MRRSALLALSLGVASVATAFSQQSRHSPQFDDPANLRGERVSAKTGRELPLDQGALGLQQLLRKLNTRASLMLIVAHPDDEDGGMLTLYSRGVGARVADLSLTRGEGGQNAVTGDFEDALGLIRTQELLSADRYTGVDQFFGTEVDFGFSKTKEEAFRKWTHERVLYDAVRAVRLYRPLVIAAVFVGGVTDGHGQHQVSGQIAQEVFKASADPNIFPELTREGILPWAPLKVYARVPGFAIQPQGLFDYATNMYVPPSFTNYVTGVTTTTPPTPDVVLHEGQTDPLLTAAAANPADLRDKTAAPNAALSYIQFARIGLGLQRTQIGPGVRLATPGAYDVSYHLYGSRLKRGPVHEGSVHEGSVHEGSFFDGIDTSLTGIASLSSAPPGTLQGGLLRLSSELTAAAKSFQPGDPAALAPALVQAEHDLGGLLDRLETTGFPGRADVLHELRVKQVQLDDAIVSALGLHLEAEAQAASSDVVRGTPLAVQTRLASASTDPVGVFSESLDAGGGNHTERLLAVDAEPLVTANRPLHQDLQATPALTGTVTRPYFFRTDVEQPFYKLNDPALRTAPATPAPLTVWATLRYRETEVRIGRIVSRGDQFVSLVPPATLSLSTRAEVLPNDAGAASLRATLIPVQTPEVLPTFTTPPGWKASPLGSSTRPGETTFQIAAPGTGRTPVVVKASATLKGSSGVSEGFRAVGYPGLLKTNDYVPATFRIVPIDLRLPTHRRVGYLGGTGDAVADTLRSVGLEVTPLAVSDLNGPSLRRFDTVVLGVRTYNAHSDLHGAPTQALLAFARDGGNVVVQYQTTEFTGADAPYPLSLGSAQKVVDETAPVQLLNADAPLFSYPNRIAPADFNGWIEERGHGFLDSWDEHYTAPTETHDPGSAAEHVLPQVPQRGGLITARVGKGHWTYCAFALYRQLPEAIPGPFRLFVNLLGLADQPPT